MHKDPFGDQFESAATSSGAADFSSYMTPQSSEQAAPVDPSTVIQSDVQKDKPGWMTDYLWRGLAGGAERGVRGIVGAAADIAEFAGKPIRFLDDEIQSGVSMAFGGSGKVASFNNGKVSYITPMEDMHLDRTGDIAKSLGVDNPFIAEADSTGAKIVQTVTSFLVPFKVAKVAVEGAELFANWGRLGAVATNVVASASAAFASADPAQGNLMNIAKDAGLDHTAIAEYTHVDSLISALSVDKDDSSLVARLKNAVVDIPTNLALTGLVDGIVAGAKGIRSVRITKAALDASATAEAHITPIAEAATHADVQAHVADVLAEEAGTVAKSAEDAPVPTSVTQEATAPVADGTVPPVAEAAPAAPAVPKTPPITTPDQMVAKMERLTNEITDEEVKAIADGFNNGTGYAGIERMGVNPARIDMTKWLSAFKNPSEMKAGLEDVLSRISSSDVGKRIADAMGSKPRSDEAAAFLARMIGGDVTGVVSSLKAKTNNLDIWVRAASSFVGTEAAKLVEHANNLKALAASGEFTFDNAAHPAYVAFLKQFETLTTLQSTMRGSFSEMGRGLRSIQATNAVKSTKDNLAAAEAVLGTDEAAKVAQAATGKAPRPGVTPATWQEKLDAIGDAKTPKDRQKLLDQVIRANGDLAQVAANVAGDEGTLAARSFRAIRETSANLFSIGTATATGLGMVGFHGISLVSGLINYPLHLLTQSDSYLVGAAINRAKWATTFPAYANGLVRAVQFTGSELIKEVGRAADGFNGSGSKSAAELSAKWEAWLGNTPVLAGDKFGKSVAGAVEHKFQMVETAKEPAIYLKPADIDSLSSQPNHGPAVMAAGMRAVVATVVNTFGAATRLGRVGTIEFLDEMTGSAVYASHRYGEATGVAMQQAMAQGLTGDALNSYVKSTAGELVSKTSRETAAEMQNLIEAGGANADRIKELAKDVITRHGIEAQAIGDARNILFQDQLQTGMGRSLKKVAQYIDPAGIVFPFVHTPLRILETGLLDFSPVGLMKRDLWAGVRSGDVKSTETMAKIALGTTAMMQGYHMAASGEAVGYDGGSQSSARSARPQYSMKVGNTWVEYGRIDPLSTVIGCGVDLYQFEKALELQGLHGDPEAQSALHNYAEAAWLTITTNILSKTYLQGLSNLTQMASPTGNSGNALWQIVSSMAQRAVPMGGIQKGVASEVSGTSSQVTDPADTLHALKLAYVSSWYFGKDVLWEKRDPFLGQVMSYDRDAGIKMANHDSDPLFKALGDLSFSVGRVPNSIQGVKLTADQQHLLLKTMGDTAVDGQTLAGSLREYAASPEWATYNDNQKVQIMKMVRQPFLDNAQETVLSQDKGLYKDVMSARMSRSLMSSGADPASVGNSIANFRRELDNAQ